MGNILKTIIFYGTLIKYKTLLINMINLRFSFRIMKFALKIEQFHNWALTVTRGEVGSVYVRTFLAM